MEKKHRKREIRRNIKKTFKKHEKKNCINFLQILLHRKHVIMHRFSVLASLNVLKRFMFKQRWDLETYFQNKQNRLEIE